MLCYQERTLNDECWKADSRGRNPTRSKRLITTDDYKMNSKSSAAAGVIQKTIKKHLHSYNKLKSFSYNGKWYNPLKIETGSLQYLISMR